MENKQYLALDVGQKRIGLARASAVARLPEPLGSTPSDRAIEEINKLIGQYKVSTVIVGLPRNLNGDDTKQTQWVRDWVVKAKSKINEPIYWQDEALTSKIAEAQASTYKKKQDSDSLAAAIILADFLATPEAERVIS